MADVTAVRNALAAQVNAHTGLRSYGQARDQAAVPCAVVLPASPLVTYGATMDGAATLNLSVIVLMTDGAPSEKVQRMLDSYLGIGAGETLSVAQAIEADPTLGGTVHFAVPVSVTNYGRLAWAGVTYFGAKVNLQCGVI